MRIELASILMEKEFLVAHSHFSDPALTKEAVLPESGSKAQCDGLRSVQLVATTVL